MSSQKPTILHVIDTTGPGGAETVFTQLAAACNQQGYRSLAIIRGPGWVEDQLNALSIEYKVIDSKGSFNISFLLNLVKVIFSENVKVIQSHLLGSNVYSSLAGILTKTPVVSTFHGHVDISPQERFQKAKLEIISVGSRHIIAVTNELLKSLQSMGNTRVKEKAEVIANGVDVDRFSKSKINDSLIDSTKEIVFGCLGNIRKAKNYFLAVDFISQLRNSGVNANLVIAGDDSGTLAGELKSYVDSIGLTSHITFAGFIDDVENYLNGIDIFLMSSSSEGHPLALTQALASGLLVISTPSGIEEIVEHGETAFISAEHTAESLTQVFKEILSLSGSELQSVRKKCRETAIKKYGISNMTNSYLSKYEK